MKILMLTPYLPFPLVTGGQTRSYNLIKRLSELGHEITLFCLVKEEKERENIHELEKFCQEVRVFKRPQEPWTLTNIIKTGFSLFPFLVVRNWAAGEKEAIEEKLSKEKFDLIHAETFYVMPHIPKTAVPIVLVDQTIEYQVYQHYVDNYKFKFLKPLLYIDVAKMKHWELKYWKEADRVVAMSEEDQRIMLSEDRSLKVDIVPNGVDSVFFDNQIFSKPDYPIVLYLGNFTWLQNREAVEVLLTQVWPKIKQEIPNVKLWIIGKDAQNFFSHLKSEDIRVEEIKDVREAYQGASVLVAPIYGSGGTRYKNFEAFASGLPVVTTSIGIGGTDATNNVDVLVRDKPEDIARAAVSLLKDKKLHQKIADNAKKMVKEKYDWGSISQKLNKIYLEVRHG
ncbi:glycosyltransferase family 4 protein [Candidatus Daviesbacteria bacterium]|nr:glycosyltransferase family 4 protein [Candidatus Daviesbacteria bacterium]